MGMWVWKIGILTLLLLGSVAWAAEPTVCPTESITNSLFGFRHRSCPLPKESPFPHGVIEGDELSLQTVLNMVNNNSHAYVAVLFYASWCPFSRTFRPTFSTLSSFYPSIPHFAFKESAIKPRTLSKYGVSGFPTLFVLNSTMRRRYHGSRTLGALFDFHTNVTGITIAQIFEGAMQEEQFPKSYECQGMGFQVSCNCLNWRHKRCACE